MRTTLDVDDDVLQAAREIARSRKITIGEVISNLARQSLTRHIDAGTRNGVPLFPIQAEGKIVTLELVNELREDAP